MPRKATKSRQKGPKLRGPYTPQPVQERVIAGHLAGQSTRRIAREEGIDRKTVDRILTQQEVVQMRSQYKHRLFSFVPKALDVLEETLSSDDERIRFTAATKILEALQVMPRGSNGQLNPQSDMLDMMIAQIQTDGMPSRTVRSDEAAAPNSRRS